MTQTKRKSKFEVELDRRFHAAFDAHATGIPFDIFDLSRIRNDFDAAVMSGMDDGTAMIGIVAKYRKD